MSARIFLCRTLLMALLLVISACKPDMIPQPDKTFPELTNWLTEQKAQITYGLSGQTPDMPTAFKQGYILSNVSPTRGGGFLKIMDRSKTVCLKD